MLSKTQRIRVSGFVTASSGADVCGWLQYGPVSCGRGLAKTRASAGGVESSGSGVQWAWLRSWLHHTLVWDLSQVNISKPKFSCPGTASPP